MDLSERLGPFFLWGLFLTGVAALWPRPEHFELGSGILWLSPTLDYIPLVIEQDEPLQDRSWVDWAKVQYIVGSIVLMRIENPASDSSIIKPKNPPYEYDDWNATRVSVEAAFDRFKNDVFKSNVVPRKFHPTGAAFQPKQESPTSRQSILKVVMRKVSNLQYNGRSPQTRPESYLLRISTDGKIQIDFETNACGLHALQTLSQLFYRHSDGGVYTPFAPVVVFDSPRFEHRGLNLDISRNQIFPEDVLRTLDAMACSKLNRLHLHAADSQSWPLDIPALPELAAQGAYDEGQIWSAKCLREVQEYGKQRGIEVYVEIDLPGHATAIGHAFPNLVVAGNKANWSHFALEPPSGQMKLNSS